MSPCGTGIAGAHNAYYGKYQKDRQTAGTGTTPVSTYGLSAELLTTVTGVHIDTVRRWKRAGIVPRHFADIVALRTAGDLGVLSPLWSGWTFLRGELWTPDNWGPITPGDIASIPIRMQQISVYERLFVAAAEDITL